MAEATHGVTGRVEGVQEGGRRPGKGCKRSQDRRSGALSPDLESLQQTGLSSPAPCRRQEECAPKTSPLWNSVSGVRLRLRAASGSVRALCPTPLPSYEPLALSAVAASPRFAPRWSRLCAAGTSPSALPPAPPGVFGVRRETRGVSPPPSGSRLESGLSPRLCAWHPSAGVGRLPAPVLGASLTGSRPSGLSASGT